MEANGLEPHGFLRDFLQSDRLHEMIDGSARPPRLRALRLLVGGDVDPAAEILRSPRPTCSAALIKQILDEILGPPGFDRGPRGRVARGMGTYLVACVFYAAIFRESPVGLPYDDRMPAKEVAELQAIASHTVLGG
jgi:hypothetical protein